MFPLLRLCPFGALLRIFILLQAESLGDPSSRNMDTHVHSKKEDEINYSDNETPATAAPALALAPAPVSEPDAEAPAPELPQLSPSKSP